MSWYICKWAARKKIRGKRLGCTLIDLQYIFNLMKSFYGKQPVLFSYHSHTSQYSIHELLRSLYKYALYQNLESPIPVSIHFLMLESKALESDRRGIAQAGVGGLCSALQLDIRTGHPNSETTAYLYVYAPTTVHGTLSHDNIQCPVKYV